RMKFAQLWPGKNNTMTVDDEIMSAFRHCEILCVDQRTVVRPTIRIRTTLRERTPCLSVACLVLAASRWLAALLSCVLNKLVVACAWLVHDAVVPRRVLSIKTSRNAIRIQIHRSSKCQAEIAIAFAHDPLLKSTPNEPQGIGGFRSHVKKRDRTCHCVPGSGRVFRLFEQPKSESAPRKRGERTGRARRRRAPAGTAKTECPK